MYIYSYIYILTYIYIHIFKSSSFTYTLVEPSVYVRKRNEKTNGSMYKIGLANNIIVTIFLYEHFYQEKFRWKIIK